MNHTKDQLLEIAQKSHEGATEIYGYDWFLANRMAVHALYQEGFDPSDPLVKAISSLVLRHALAQVLLSKTEGSK